MASPTPFIRKLWDIVNSSDKSIVDWRSDGDGFIVYNIAEFSKNILPRYFNSNPCSFVRQLNLYGFTKLGDGFEFKHSEALFRRGDEKSLHSIERRKDAKKKRQSGEQESPKSGDELHFLEEIEPSHQSPNSSSTPTDPSPRLSPNNQPSPPVNLIPTATFVPSPATQHYAAVQSPTDSVFQSLLQSNSSQNNMISYLAQELEHQRQENAALKRQLSEFSQYLNVKQQIMDPSMKQNIPSTAAYPNQVYAFHQQVSAPLMSKPTMASVNIPAPVPASRYAQMAPMGQPILIHDEQQTSPLPKPAYKPKIDPSLAENQITIIPDQVSGNIPYEQNTDLFDFATPQDRDDLFSMFQNVNLSEDQII